MNKEGKGDIVVMELDKKSDLLSLKCECPGCGSKYIRGVPYAHVSCKKCGLNYRTKFDQSLFMKKATQIISAISFHNGVTIKMPSIYEQDIIQIQKLFQLQGCWEVSEITDSIKHYARCKHCGTCMNCYTCKKCWTTFTRDPNKRKTRCPKCSSDSFAKTYFKEAIASDNKAIRLCPYCKSDDIKMTLVKGKTCPHCKRKDLMAEKALTIHEITIERKKAYRRENL